MSDHASLAWSRDHPHGPPSLSFAMSTDTQLLVGGERTTGESVRSQNGEYELTIFTL